MHAPIIVRQAKGALSRTCFTRPILRSAPASDLSSKGHGHENSQTGNTTSSAATSGDAIEDSSSSSSRPNGRT
eukprot:8054624-Pyramimonas_sp.AAC.1